MRGNKLQGCEINDSSEFRPLGHQLSPLGVGDELGREGVPHLAEVAQAADSVADLAQQLGQVRQTVLVQAENDIDFILLPIVFVICTDMDTYSEEMRGIHLYKSK